MQLSMTAPLDIGLEQADASLGIGQDDIFDLGEQSRVRGRKALGDALGGQGLDDEHSGDDEDMEDGSESEDEGLDSDEEARRRADVLEGEMDAMYDDYQDRLKERDAKYKVRKARESNKEREEWGGIKRRGDADSDSEEEEEEEGGWDTIQHAKERVHDASSDESGSDSDDDDAPPRAKRKLDASTSSRTKTPVAGTSQAAKVWFSQDLFKSAGLEDVESDEENESDEEEDEEVPEVKAFFSSLAQ